MPGHFLAQRLSGGFKCWQRFSITLFQLLYARRQLLGNTLNLRLDPCLQRCQPLILHYQRFNRCFIERGIMCKYRSIQRFLCGYQRLFRTGLGLNQRQTAVQHCQLIRVGRGFLQLCQTGIHQLLRHLIFIVFRLSQQILFPCLLLDEFH